MKPDLLRLRCLKCRRTYAVDASRYRPGQKCARCNHPLEPPEEPPPRKAAEQPAAGGFNLELVGEDESRRKVPAGLAEALKGRYEIMEPIGRGGMGIVYKALQRGLDRIVALKVMIGGEGASPAMIERFVREARAAGSLRHPNIVQVHDAGEAAGLHYFAMDYIEGIPLQKMMKGKALDPPKAAAMVSKIARALDFAHHNKIVHRDLKPANVIVDFQGEPHIMDFGLARDFRQQSDLSVSGSLIGTPAYMSPEAARGEVREVDHRSDVYSLGVILYEMLTHSQPFQGDTLYDTITRVLQAEPPPVRQFDESLGKDLDTIVARAIEKSPEGRYQSMGAFADDLDRYLRGEPIAARAVTPAERMWRRVRRHRAAIAVAAVALLVVAALAYVLATRTSYTAEMGKLLRSPDARVRLDTVAALGHRMAGGRMRSSSERGRIASMLLTLAASDPEAAVRRAAVAAAREGAAKQSVGVLCRIADRDEDDQVVLEAVETLERLGDPACVPTLEQVALSARSDACRLAAIRALKTLRGPDTRRVLMTIDSDPMENRAIRLAAHDAMGEAATKDFYSDKFKTGIFALPGVKEQRDRIVGIYRDYNKQLEGAMDQEPEAPAGQPAEKGGAVRPAMNLGQAIRKLHEGTDDERMEAAFALGVLGDPRAASALVGALEDASPLVSNAAADALIKLRRYPDVSQAAALMGSPQAHTRANAALLAGESGERSLGDSVLLLLGKETDPRAMCAALGAVAKLRPRGARLVVADILKNAESPRVREAAQAALAALPQ